MDQSRPKIYVDIHQPGDRGEFIIQVKDPQTDTVICRNQLPEAVNNIQFLYTARLIERPDVVPQNDTQQQLRQEQRREDLVRYGKKLYKDLFGEKPNFQRYLKRAKHLQKGLSSHYVCTAPPPSYGIFPGSTSMTVSSF